MMSRFSSFVLALLLLVASGQAFAADVSGTCTSITLGGDWTTTATWATGATNTGCDDGTTQYVPDATDDVVIPSTTAVTAGTGSLLAQSVTIDNGGKFTLGSNTLTISGDFTNNATAAADVNLAGSAVAFDAAATISGSAVTTFNHLSITGGALTIAAATSIVGGDFAFGTGGILAVGSVLKLDATGTTHTITPLDGGRAIPSLDLSAATVDKTIVSATDALTINGVVWSTTVGRKVTFTPPATTTDMVVTVPAPTTVSCVNGTTTITTASTVTVAAGTSMVCTVPSGTTGGVSAPIFSTKEKATVFSQEVK
jgi:hypothetical protein